MYSSSQKILTLPEMAMRVQSWRITDNRVAFTNGCFDLLHLGHVDYLEKVAAFADFLVVGVNTDASVSNLKGSSRPLTDEVSRTRVLASLEFVDGVVLFEEDTPLKLINTLKPDVLAKGADYELADIVGAKEVLSWGGQVERIEFVEGYSTSAIVAKIQNA